MPTALACKILLRLFLNCASGRNECCGNLALQLEHHASRYDIIQSGQYLH